MLKTLTATRYLTPLREGGSLPAIMEMDDGSLYVVKFSGAGQGPKALIAELITGEIARRLGLRVPELALIELDPELALSEPDSEVQDLIRRSGGLNLGLRYLPNAYAFNSLLKPPPDPHEASAIVWLDSFTTNVDRTSRNVNMLIWQEELWLIDHGASLYFHHDWDDYLVRSRTPFMLIKEHTLLPFAEALSQVDTTLRPLLTATVVEDIIDQIPSVWLDHDTTFATHAEHRKAYVAYLLSRLQAAPVFVEEAINARRKLI